MPRMGVLGGTFDPIHIGHLIVAQEALAARGLSRVFFVPAGRPPHKLDRPITDPEQRVAMAHLATADNEALAVSRVDIDRAGPCYSVDTIRLLQTAWGPEVEIDFLIGADALADLPTWRSPDLLIRLCRVVAMGRPGHAIDLHRMERALPGAASLIQTLDVPRIEISATDIRRRVREGRSIRYMVPSAVERYIHACGLYRDEREG